MDVLLSISLRAVIPAGIAGIWLALARAKSAATRHAVWSLVTVGMLASAIAPVLAPVELHVLPARPAPTSTPVSTIETVTLTEPMAPVPAQPVRQSFTWQQVAVLIYGAGALFSLARLTGGCAYARRLVRGSQHIEIELYESSSIATPMTVGCLRPRILLPLEWRTWGAAQLQAVLAHERAHIRRGDWAVAAVAAVNRSVFWFHPLAWWLERTLSTLAEQACDDAAVLETGRPADYAHALLEMAAAVKAVRGRVAWQTMAMAKATAEVSLRIDRILDEARTISTGLSRRSKVTMAAVGMPLIYAAAVLQVAPIVAQEQTKPQRTEQSQATPAKPVEQAAPGPALTPVPPAQEAPRPAPAPARAAQEAPPAAAAPEAPAQVATPNSQTRLINRVDPEYPKIAKQTGAKGSVLMDLVIAPDGHVSEVKVISGHPMLQNAAKEAVLKWRYTPQPTETVSRVTLNFVGEVGAPSPSQGLGGNIQQAVLISRKEPAYPEAAKLAGIRGTVVVNATISKDGHVKAVRAVKGDPMLIDPAIAAVEQWYYKPTMLNGQPVETETQITLNFTGGPPVETPQAQIPGMEKAVLISRTEPVHPGGDLASLEGTVSFIAGVGTDGRLKNIRVTDGPAELVAPSLDAVKQWIYRPATLNGTPIDSYVEIRMPFKALR
jgi:TonB family protein